LTKANRPGWSLSGPQMHLRILATTDLHLQVMPYDYFADRRLPDSGLAQTASLIKALRQIDGACLLLDNGDFLQGNPLSDWLAKDSGFGPGDLHPMIAAMNALGYDGGTLGNHDFNYGLEFLRNALARAEFPVVSANMTLQQADKPEADVTLQPPWAILPRDVTTADGETHLLNIGIIGFAPPQTPIWEQFSIGSLIGARDIVEAARAHVPRLRAAGADLVIALAHSGIGQQPAVPGQENAGLVLASVPGIDAIVVGHTHQVFPGPGSEARPDVDPVAGTLHGKPAVMAGSLGSHVGVIDLKLAKGTSGWTATEFRVETLALASARPGPSRPVAMDKAVVASVKASHDKVMALLQEQIGETSTGLHSFLSFVGHAPASTVLADAMRSAATSALCGTELDGLPMVVAVAPSRSGGMAGPDNYVDIPPGPLLRRHAAELYHYPNTLCVLAQTGAEIRDWLEWSARLFRQIEPGAQDQMLVDPAMAGYNFDTLFGLHYQIDPSQPVATAPRNGGGQRISDLRKADGTELGADETLLLVVNNYRASGGGGYAMAASDRIMLTSNLALRDITLRYLQSARISPSATPVWTFRPLPGTTAVFDSGAGARAHLADLPALTVEEAGAGADGFQRFRLRF
jgi:2',3'-cyclic-nucleotide 2'-phosphodiesterase / 3'-nucleotidase